MCSLLRRPTIHQVAVAAAARSILLKALALTWRLKHRLSLLAKVTIPSKHL